MDVITVLAINLAVLAAGFFILWLVCLLLKDATIVDAYWALGMVVLAISTFLQSGQGERALLLLALTALWGARLTAYMYWRWRDHGPDRRYRRMFERLKDEKGWGFARASLVAVILTQAPLQYLVSLPVQLGQIDAVPAALGALAWTGAALAIFGLVFESIADWQLTRFRRDPANAGQVMQTGLWKYSRHPNYFGEALVWWGLFLIAAETSTGLWSVVGPAFLTWTLIKWSGAPTMEFRMRKTKPGYVAYIERTSGFIPWPPRKA